MKEEALKVYKRLLIELMEYFDQFCNENNLSYFACSGTAIGAIRHKGFIPWDDDIDVFMPRKDYNKLMGIRDQLMEGYAIKNLGDNNYIYSFAKIFNTNTTLIEYSCFPNCLIGVFIDIFPLDQVSGTFDEILLKKRKYTSKYICFQDTFRYISIRDILSQLYHLNFKRFIELSSQLVSSDARKQRFRDKFYEYEYLWAEERGDLLMTHSCIYRLDKELFPKYWFQEAIYMDFENFKIRLPKEYDKYLTQLYGDYMTPPPLEKRFSDHHHYYLNLKEGLSVEETKVRIANGESLVY